MLIALLLVYLNELQFIGCVDKLGEMGTGLRIEAIGVEVEFVERFEAGAGLDRLDHFFCLALSERVLVEVQISQGLKPHQKLCQ